MVEIKGFVIPAVLFILGLIGAYILIFKILGLRVIGTNEVGIVEKWWSPKGNLQDRKFIALNWEAGFQPDVLRTGIHFKSCLIYRVEKSPLVTISQGQIGYVFARDGEPLKETQTLGRVVDCANYQDTKAFLGNGGQKGPQRAILREGTYAFNLSAFIIFTEATDYYINMGNKQDAEQIKRMSDDLRAQNGFRPVVIKEVTLITRDAFEPTLPLSVVVHIDYKKAPLVIQRFGDIKRLVDQTLDPMVSSYFKNIAQRMTLIELIQNRSEIQKQSTDDMKSKFENYNLELEEVLIGTPSPNGDKKIEEILKQLSDRQLAKEKIETYSSQMKASEKEKELKEFQAKSAQQEELTKSDINIKIQDNIGKAELQKARQDAEKQKTLADAEAYKVKRIAEAQAEMKARLGIAQAIATKEQVNAYGGPQYQVIQDVMTKFTDAIREGKINIVPNNVVTMGGSENNGNVNAVESLLAVLLSEKIGVDFKIDQEESDFAKKMKADIYKKMNEEKSDNYVIPKEEIEVKENDDNNTKIKEDEIKEKITTK